MVMAELYALLKIHLGNVDRPGWTMASWSVTRATASRDSIGRAKPTSVNLRKCGSVLQGVLSSNYDKQDLPPYMLFGLVLIA